MTTEPATTRRPVVARRAAAAAIAATVVALDLVAKALAQAHLDGDGVRLGPLWLRLSYNPGAAFSLGADAPRWLVPALTTAIVASIGIYAWRTTRTAPRLQLAAVAAMFGGGLANLIDRIPDRVVTDYLDQGWWPSFNLADATLCIAVGILVVSALRTPSERPGESPPRSRTRGPR